jgi:hypothetical protein
LPLRVRKDPQARQAFKELQEAKAHKGHKVWLALWGQ